MGKNKTSKRSKRSLKKTKKKEKSKATRSLKVYGSKLLSVMRNKRSKTIRRNLNKHLTKMKSLVEEGNRKTRMLRFLKHLISLGREKGQIDQDDLFVERKNSEEILSFIIKKYGIGQCGRTDPIKLTIEKTIATYVDSGKKIIYELNVNGITDIIRCLSKGIKRLIVYFSSDNNDAYNNVGHANLLVIDSDTKEIIRIDPNGDDRSVDSHYFEEVGNRLAEKINKKFPVDGDDKYKYIDVFQLECPLNPQLRLGKLRYAKEFITNKEIVPTEAEEGSCVLWSILFLELVLTFQELTFKEVLQHLSSYTNVEASTTVYLIRGYFWYLKREVFPSLDVIPEEEKTKTRVSEEYPTVPEFKKYILDLESDKIKYSILEFKGKHDDIKKKIQKIILLIFSEEDETLKREFQVTLNFYKDLDELYTVTKTKIDDKKSEEEKKLIEELLYLIYLPKQSDPITKLTIMRKYGNAGAALDNIKNLLLKHKDSFDEEFYNEATRRIQSLPL